MNKVIRWVRVKRSILSDYAGHTGLVVQASDRGAAKYLRVRFADGQELSFHRSELVAIDGPPSAE